MALGRLVPVLVLGALCAGSATGGQLQLRLDDALQSSTHGTVELTGLTPTQLKDLAALDVDARRGLFEVYTGVALPEDGARPAMLGTWDLDGTTARFLPRFPLVPGQPYVARWRGPGGPLSATFSLPAPKLEATTTVLAVDPSTGTVPENLLKLYLRFSAAMSEGEARQHLRLVDETTGIEVAEPWVAPDHELWNGAKDRLTLFFDPGRIKRGVGPNAELGPPLREGHLYRLEVDSAWRDALGAPLAAPFAKRFRVGPPDRERPLLESWELRAPKAPGDKLEVLFPEPLDRALLARLLWVEGADGEPIEGSVRISREERGWSFQPDALWHPGEHNLVIGTALEDLAGNSLRRPFETEIDTKADARRVLRLPFSVD